MARSTFRRTPAQGSQGSASDDCGCLPVAAIYEAFDESRDIEPRDVVRCIGETVPLSTTMREGIQELRAWARERTRPASSAQWKDDAPGKKGG